MTKPLMVGLLGCTLLLLRGWSIHAADRASADLFAKQNLVAWCIVPFDSKKRGPEERAAMLEKLGFSKFAYDYRAEHIPTFDAEIEALKRHHVELSAWWFPTSLNDEAKMTLAVFEKHKVTPDLWVTGGGGPTKPDQERQQRVLDEAARIRPIAEAAAKVGSKVALYNHGGWFGEPENQIAIIRELNLPNVGIIYNQHHGHDHLDRFPEMLKKMLPYLYTLNLNGMVKDGDRKGQKILQLGQGDLDLKLLKVIKDSGYKGPIGILGHTNDDAEERLHDNLDGLDWLVPQLDGKAAGPKPKTRTPIPVAQGQAAAPAANPNVPRLADGKFGKALDGRSGGAFVAGREEFRQFPITVECWTKLTDKGPYNILVAHELKSSGTHWELFTVGGSGNFTVYVPGFSPDHCHSNSMICDGKWHHVAMVLESERLRLFVDGRQVADQTQQRNGVKAVPGDLALASLVDRQIGCTGLLDEVRISRGVRAIAAIPEKPFEVDESTLGLWHLDELVEQKRFDDAAKLSPALIGLAPPTANPVAAKSGKIEGHWGEDALGFRWTENQSRDDRFGQMDTGPFFSGSITGPGGIVYKGIVVRVGDKRTASICYDTELLRASAGWTGFLKFDAARFGIIVPPKIDGDLTFSTPVLAGWTRTEQFSNVRESSRYGPLPKTQAHYEGLYRHGQRVVLRFMVGSEAPADDSKPSKQPPTFVLESPWLETVDGVSALSRTLLIGPSTTPLMMLVAEQQSRVRLIAATGTATIQAGPQKSHIMVVPPHSSPVTIKLLVASIAVNEAAFEKLVAASPTAIDLLEFTQPGPSIWGEPLVTVGEVSTTDTQFAVDTITLPFENPFRALMFCGGHDFLSDGRAVVCTLHGDVWLVDGIDKTLHAITWRRFATGLFQPLGIKVMRASKVGNSTFGTTGVYVVGRDQITRLHDSNGDGEADFYENLNNDAHVSLNGHEYVTSLETDRAGNFYFVKGNCNSGTPHDGSLLQVSADGSQLKVFATGFRNSNGIGIGPNDEITVAPQEGEWTPASAVFAVRQGGFYGGMMSHHQSPLPTDFERPLCWFPRLADNSCGGQVWVPNDHWGPLTNHMLHLSYGQCKLRLVLREELTNDIPGNANNGTMTRPPRIALRRSPLISMNGGSIELPISFASGIHRGRFNPKDGHLYLTGLKGWVTSAVNDGCFQRVRFTDRGVDLPVAMKTYRNGVALSFTRSLNRDEVENIDNYELEVWNYHWSGTYGSPDLKPSSPGQVGRDPVEPKSVTLLDDQRTVFIEIPDLKPVDQMGITYSLRSAEGTAIEQTVYLTLNGVPDQTVPEDKLHRSTKDLERAEMLARLSPGLLFQFERSMDSPIPRRLIAWPEMDSSPSGAFVTASGYLKVPATGAYSFSAESKSETTITIDGQQFVIGNLPVKVPLRRGLSRFQIEQTSPASTSQFRLMWESDSFPREAVPPTVLFHDPTHFDGDRDRQKILDGQSLFAERKCNQCHSSAAFESEQFLAATQVERLRQAPGLQGIGSRLKPDWLAAWLRNPAHLRPDATMPTIIASQDDGALADLVAYLASLREVDRPPNETAPEPTESQAARIKEGGVLFERLGCIACHRFAPNDANPEWNRVSLQFISAKFQPGQLVEFLRAPHRHHVGSHMPDFRLNAGEAVALATYLEQSAKGEITRFEPTRTGDVDRGRKLFQDSRCDHCHQVTADEKLASRKIPVAGKLNFRSGCLADDTNARRAAPAFPSTDDQRDALTAFLSSASNPSNISDRSKLGIVPHALKSLRCNACHSRDGTSSIWPEIVAEEGSGKPTEAVPQLTWVGEKLQGSWIAKLLKGDVSQKPRPWLTARMPEFPEYAQIIAHGLADEHGVNFEESLPKEFDSDRIELGRRLTLRDGGLDCRQCHGVGKELPRGDAATQIALGVNFAQTRERLRPEFTLRQLLDPPRYDVGSRMPRFAPDLRTTAAKQIESGDARKQFEAIKQYLFSLDAIKNDEPRGATQ